MSKTVLAIDDSQFMLNTIRTLLENDGYECIEALNGDDGIEKYKNNNIDVVLLDIKLGEEDGIEVLKKLHDIDPDIKVAMVSAMSADYNRSEAELLGASAFIKKPINYREFHLTLERMFE